MEAGWTVTITRNGRAVARLVPIAPPGDPLDVMVSTGAALRAEDTADLLDVEVTRAVRRSQPQALLQTQQVVSRLNKLNRLTAFVGYDERLNAAVRAAGLAVATPGVDQ